MSTSMLYHGFGVRGYKHVNHFHIIKLFHDKLSEIRRKLFNQVSTIMGKRVLKGTRWLLLKNPENLNDDKDETKRL